MATIVVTVPPSLAFFVSNFHSLVNIRLDGCNYLLWQIEVENVMDANGFYGYLDGSIVVPPSQIRDAQGEQALNPFGVSHSLSLTHNTSICFCSSSYS
ncbi:hypothetical protein RHGRI_023112 [Rhododendron griersonianum]|uniref:Retrotransposon Copia-like N-terminal domain-containing protein n=1 Tax=Rhododendron griersonianum TaxID=479676 RepID=A0AAV6J7T4_9ERIC|nr:hypothetical protein RHGRI_023112 [Rhododendron griersonianum]